eukprot:g14171.t1
MIHGDEEFDGTVLEEKLENWMWNDDSPSESTVDACLELVRARHGDKVLFPYLANTVGGLIVLRACFALAHEFFPPEVDEAPPDPMALPAYHHTRLREFLPVVAAHWRELTRSLAGISLLTAFYVMRDDKTQDLATILAHAGGWPGAEEDRPEEEQRLVHVRGIATFVEDLVKKNDPKGMAGGLLFGQVETLPARVDALYGGLPEGRLTEEDFLGEHIEAAWKNFQYFCPGGSTGGPEYMLVYANELLEDIFAQGVGAHMAI